MRGRKVEHDAIQHSNILVKIVSGQKCYPSTFLFKIIKSVHCEISNMFDVKDYNSVLDLSGRQQFTNLQFTAIVS